MCRVNRTRIGEEKIVMQAETACMREVWCSVVLAFWFFAAIYPLCPA